MNVNWFSPLPPARTGIADFARDILPTLSRHTETNLWTDQSDWDSDLEKYARVRRFSLKQMPWTEMNRAEISFFNLGNDHLFHGSIWKVSRLLPGVTILHDLHLDEFFENLLRDHNEARQSFLGATIDAQSAHPGDSMITAQHSANLELSLENSLGVLVHTKQAHDELKAAGRWPVAYAPLPFSQRVSAPVRPIKSQGARYRIIVFGFINRNRRLDALLEALGTSRHNDKFQLDIYGVLWDPGYVREQILKHGLRRQVSIKGFVSEAALDRALASADLAVNLRNPTMGEASISQLRIWSHALPSIVTSVGWYAGIPDTVAAHVAPEREVSDIKNHLSSFLADPARFAEMGREGQRLLAEHEPQRYVRAMLDLATKAVEFRPRAQAHYLARRAGQSMSPWIGAMTSDDPLKRVALEILSLTGASTSRIK